MDFIRNQLEELGMTEPSIGYVSNAIMVIFIALISIIANYIAKRLVLKTVHRIVSHNRFKWGISWFRKAVPAAISSRSRNYYLLHGLYFSKLSGFD